MRVENEQFEVEEEQDQQPFEQSFGQLDFDQGKYRHHLLHFDPITLNAHFLLIACVIKLKTLRTNSSHF